MYSILAVTGVLLLHASVNVLNDYYDFMHGVDSPNSPTAVYRRQPLVMGTVSPSFVRNLGFSLIIAGSSIGVYLTIMEGYLILVLGLLGVFLLYAYIGPPFTLKYRGLGELSVALTWGPLLVSGFFVAASGGSLPPSTLLISLPPLFIMFSIIYANNYRDREYDAKAGIKTLAMLTARHGYGIYLGSLITAYVINVVLVIMGVIPFTTLATLLTIALIPGLAKAFRGNAHDIDAKTGLLYTIYCLIYGVALMMPR
ncbi:prenyltransferase [Vulcanisaeta sp. JCM 16161]|uniref:prenyltransferase n=1 Tax=Vulcanisaeta sp. JCM 16161 TaxID=1295372 RepID=UPI000AAC5A37|nr:prenyltransferase [Vulcanisaeta sp. JCM 16161]